MWLKWVVMLVWMMYGVQAVDEMPPGAYAGAVQVLSREPRIFVIEHFLSDEECQHLIKRAKPALQRSTVVSNDLKNGDVSQLDVSRTSQGMFLENPTRDPILKRIEARIAALTLLPEENGEGMQILRYQVGGEYRPHHDYFDPTTPGGSACYHRGGQRVATLVMYLENTEEGGETIFPYADVVASPIKGNATTSA